MNDNKLTAETFLKGLSNFENTCGSCRFFSFDNKECSEKKESVDKHSPKCNKWRYFA